MRKALIPSALAAVLLTTGCEGSVTISAPTSTPSVSSSASPTTSPKLERVTPAPSAPAKTTAPKAPTVKTPAAPAATGETATVIAEAKKTIASIPVKGRAPKTGYERSNFGPAWADVDRNGCDTRNDILERDMTNETYKDGTKQCVLATGTLADKYTGKTIQWKRGQKTSSLVQIDHIISLSNSWQTGAQQLSAEKRKQFSNDPINLMASDGSANMQKGDKDAASWLPANKSFRCEYVSKQTIVKAKYGLWMTQAEKNTISGILATC